MMRITAFVFLLFIVAVIYYIAAVYLYSKPVGDLIRSYTEKIKNKFRSTDSSRRKSRKRRKF